MNYKMAILVAASLFAVVAVAPAASAIPEPDLPGDYDPVEEVQDFINGGCIDHPAGGPKAC